MELMTPEGGTIFWTAVTFIILAFTLYKVGWKPMLRMLEEREIRIRESLEAAERAKGRSEKMTEDRQKLIDATQVEAHEIIIAARQAAHTVKNEMIEAARLESDKLIERAKYEIELHRDKVMHDMSKLVIELSMAATEKLISVKLTPKDHEIMIQTVMEKMEQLI